LFRSGTTEVAVISLGGIVTSRSIKVAGNNMDHSITQYIRQKYNLMIGERTAEEIKMNIGSATPPEEDESMDIRGRNLLTGLPETMSVSSSEITGALKESVDKIVHYVKTALRKRTTG